MKIYGSKKPFSGKDPGRRNKHTKLKKTNASIEPTAYDPDLIPVPGRGRIERLADFLMSKVIGKGEMDRAACIDFWSEEVDVCEDVQP